MLEIARRDRLGPVSAEWLIESTGYSDKPVYRALKLLEDYGLVERGVRYGWVITREADEPVERSTPLPGEIAAQEIADPGIQDAVSGTPNLAYAEMVDAGPRAAGIATAKIAADVMDWAVRKISSTENFRTSSSSRYLDSRNPENLLPPARCRDPENLRTGGPAAQDSHAGDSRYAAVFAVLNQGGVRDPARSRIAANPFVTPLIAQYHLATCQSIGQAIHRIEHDWPPDPDWRPPEVEAADTGGEEQRPLSAEEAAAEAADEAAAASAEEAAEKAWEAAEPVFQAAVQSLAGSFSRAEFVTWVGCLGLGPVEGDVYQVETGNKFSLDWLEERHVADLLEKALRTITGQEIKVRLRVR